MTPMDKQKLKKIGLWILDIALNIAIVLATVLLIEKFLIVPFDIYGPSMCDTLNNIDDKCQTEYGDKVILNKASYYVTDPERGDIIVFTPKNTDEKFLIKRIVGLPGETVEILDGYVYVTNKENPKGTKLEEPYLNESNLGKTKNFAGPQTVFQVPENRYFVLGDNRHSSTDSRSCFSGSYEGCKNDLTNAFVSKENIEGRAWFIFWPFDKIEVLDDTKYPELTPTPSPSK